MTEKKLEKHLKGIKIMHKVNIFSEISRLQKIIIHSPGREHNFVEPNNVAEYIEKDGKIIENPDYLLFDDIVLLSRMQNDHAHLKDVLVATCGYENVFDFTQLLEGVLHSEKVKIELINEVVNQEKNYGWEVSEKHLKLMQNNLDPHELSFTFMSGHLPNSYEKVLNWPLPNTMFARDLVAAVGNAFVLSYASENARKRDMLLSRTIIQNHKAFADCELIDLQGSENGLTVEGGDILVISDKIVLIGISERTRFDVVKHLAPQIFAQGFEVIYAVDMPKKRATMHLDTIFTRTNFDECLAFSPIILAEGTDDLHLNIFRFTSDEKKFEHKNPVGSNLIRVLEKDKLHLNPIICGGSNPIHQAREQWSDGANAFAIAPGKILMYERNKHTLKELNKVGYEVISSDDFVKNADLFLNDFERKMAITVFGYELSRGRGGPRCLTCPIIRA